jgi:ATP-binding cassette subfamily B protein
MALSMIFSPMTPEDRREVLTRASVERFAAGETIVTQGEHGDKMYLIKSGHVTVSVRATEAAEETEITGLEPGDFFGEIALALGRPRVATVGAVTGVELIAFSRPVIKEILDRYGEVRGLLERVVKERVIDVIKVRGAKPGNLV